jgi:hypothetical protein
MARTSDRRATVRALRRIVELTEDLSEDAPADAALRDRLELAAALLEAENRVRP